METQQTEAVEVEFEDALAEERNESPRAAPGTPVFTPASSQPQTQADDIQQRAEIAQTEDGETVAAIESKKAEVEDDIEILTPKWAACEWKIGPEPNPHTYIQDQLSVIGEIQWFALLGEFLDKAMTGEGAISINALLSPPQRRKAGQFSVTDFQDADTFVHALGKLMVFMPEFMEKSICIWLSVPDYEWDLVRDYMKMSPSRGGMSHDDFEEILATFIDQNYPAIDRFFRERFGRLRARYQARAQEASQSRSSKR